MLLRKDSVDTVAIGGFDGIHRGHIQLIKRLGNNGALIVIDRDGANLTPMSKRSEYSKYPCMFYHFDKIKSYTGEEFVALLKKDFPKLKKIIVGYDFVFGKGRSHDAKELKSIFDGDVDIVDEYLYDGISVHSSIIRQRIKEGNINSANRLLGREYAITGDIVSGQGLGKKELYPTLNLRVHSFLLPKNGVYATRTCINDKVYNSVSFIGVRLSIDEKFSIETHIIDEISIDEASWLELVFVDFLRDNRRFNSLSELKSQITKDIKKAKKSLLTCRVHFEDKSK